jgi:plasmid stabilization system protein ParE
MTKLRVVSIAEREYTEALCWYAERSQTAAEGFDAEFDKALAAIRANPGGYPACDSQHRFYLMDRYPFQIIYREELDEVVVIAVAHAKRRPRYWAKRSRKHDD